MAKSKPLVTKKASVTSANSIASSKEAEKMMN